ncbi:zinc finger, CCHC-type containing protein [Tanacetum coccineum]
MLDVIEDEIDASRVQVNSSGDSMVFNPPRSNIKVTCRKCGKPRHLKKDCNSGNKANGLGTNGLVDGFTNSLKGATMHVCKDRCWFKTYESLNDASILHMGNESIALVHGRAFMSTSKVNDSILWHARLGHVHFKRMQDMSKDGLISAFDMDNEKCKTCMLTKIIKKPFQSVKRKTKVLELIYSDLCDLHVTHSPGNKKYFVTFIDDASRFRIDRGGEYMDTRTESRVPGVWGCRAVVRLPDPKLKTLGEKGIECIFVGYAEHSKAFSPRPSLRIPNGIEDIGGSVVPKEFTKEVVQQPELVLRKNKRNRTPNKFGPELRLYLIEGTRDEVSDQHSYCFNFDDDPKTFDEAIKKLMVDGTIEKFKARLGIQGFKQKSGINYFDIYAPMARISTIRLLIAMASIHNLIIHQMNVKKAFLNGELEEEVPKQWPQTFDEVVLFNGYLLNQANKCVYRKFNETGKGVIICLYVDDMLIFGTDQVHVDLTKEFLSSRFSIKDLRQANVILEGYTDASWISNTEDNFLPMARSGLMLDWSLVVFIGFDLGIKVKGGRRFEIWWWPAKPLIASKNFEDLLNEHLSGACLQNAKRKAEQIEEEADSQRDALDTYFQRRQKRLQEAQERAELLNRAICISAYLFNEGSSHVMRIFDEEAQAMQSARNSSRMLEEATTTGTTILANHQCGGGCSDFGDDGDDGE